MAGYSYSILARDHGGYGVYVNRPETNHFDLFLIVGSLEDAVKVLNVITQCELDFDDMLEGVLG